MKNPTVKELMRFLCKCDPDAFVCRLGMEDDGTPFYSSVEMAKQIDETAYIDDSGEDRTGKIVAIC